MSSRRIIFHLSQDYYKIFKIETLILLESYNIKMLKKIGDNKPLLTIDLKVDITPSLIRDILKIGKRSSSIKRILIPIWHGNIYEVYKGRFELDRLEDFIINRPIESFAIHVHKYEPKRKYASKKIIDKIYEKVSNILGVSRVNLRDPDIITSIYIAKNGLCHIGVEFHTEKKGFGHRRPSKKPVFTPFSLDPKLGRLLINLSGVPEGGLVIDPFCGVAGIPYEASLIGVNSLCIELKWKWSMGAYINMSTIRPKVFYDIICGDSLKSILKSDDYYVASDPPYGRITSTSGKVSKLYLDFIDLFIRNARGSAFFSPFPLEEELIKRDVKILFNDEIKVHKNLVRHLYVVRGL